MALTIQRLRPGGDEDMRNIKVAAKSYYVSADGLKVYERGAKDMPPGCRLLVREGSPVDATVAEQYGIETRDAQDVARVPRAATTAVRDRGLGVGAQAAAGYERIDATARVHQETEPLAANAHRGGAGAARQVGLLREARVNEEVARIAADSPEAATAMATLSNQQMGVAASAGDPNITRQLEEGERAALGRHKATIAKAEETAKVEVETSGGDASKVDASASPSGGGASTAPSSSDTPTSGADAGPTSRTVEIPPAGKADAKTPKTASKRTRTRAPKTTGT